MNRGVKTITRFDRMKIGRSEQIRNPLSHTTIQENAFLGNRVSLRRRLLYSGEDNKAGILTCVLELIIFPGVLYNALTVLSLRFASFVPRSSDILLRQTR